MSNLHLAHDPPPSTCTLMESASQSHRQEGRWLCQVQFPVSNRSFHISALGILGGIYIFRRVHLSLSLLLGPLILWLDIGYANLPLPAVITTTALAVSSSTWLAAPLFSGTLRNAYFADPAYFPNALWSSQSPPGCRNVSGRGWEWQRRGKRGPNNHVLIAPGRSTRTEEATWPTSSLIFTHHLFPDSRHLWPFSTTSCFHG